MAMHRVVSCLAGIAVLAGCSEPRGSSGVAHSHLPVRGGATCTGTYPSYWQDPDPRFSEMWRGQTISNQPPEGWTGPVFHLSDAFPAEPVDEAAQEPWRDHRFDALFDRATAQATRTELARDYAWAVMRYIQAGNVDSGDVDTDWTACQNRVRHWYNMPFQTYATLSGREFVHGLTREAQVFFNVRSPDHPDASVTLATTMWAVAFFNPTAAYTIGTVWRPDGTAAVPAEDVSFREGAVIGKLLFVTATPKQLPMLANLPAWMANISDPAFCTCRRPDGSRCTMADESRQCARSTELWGPVRLAQFDIAVRDHRAPGTEWVFGTFVADGQRRAAEPNPWNRISPLGLMWGNDPPPPGELAHDHPADPRKNGFSEEVVFWDTVDMLNAAGGAVLSKRPGHLGCSQRLNGPADNPSSSCLSCHMTASVRDADLKTPPIMAQFGGLTSQCVTPDATDPDRGTDAGGDPASVMNGVGFAQMDGLYLANTDAGTPMSFTVQTPGGPRNVLGDRPRYAGGRRTWIALDFSLQLSISLVQWGQWQADHAAPNGAERVFSVTPPSR
jgi:hypothetical protein